MSAIRNTTITCVSAISRNIMKSMTLFYSGFLVQCTLSYGFYNFLPPYAAVHSFLSGPPCPDFESVLVKQAI